MGSGGGAPRRRWSDDEVSYDGVVTLWDAFRWSHSVKYDDGEVEARGPQNAPRRGGGRRLCPALLDVRWLSAMSCGLNIQGEDEGEVAPLPPPAGREPLGAA